MNYAFFQVLALRNVLKLFFALVDDVTASFSDATKLFIVIYLFLLRGSDRLFG